MCIKITLEHFKDTAVNVKPSQTLDTIANDMKKLYKCFNDDNSDRRYPCKAPPQKNYYQERVRIGNRVLSKEMIARKEFMMYANKLSVQNKDTIVKSFKGYIRKECIDIYVTMIWDLMLRAPEYQELYMYFISSILDEPLLSSKLKTIYLTYINDRFWYPPKTVDLNEDYDEFCDFVKWKKSAISAIKAWCLIVNKNLLVKNSLNDITEHLITDLEKELSSVIEGELIGNRIIDTLLEQLLTLLKIENVKNENVATFLKECLSKRESFKSSTKFKLFDIEKVLQ